MQRIKSHTGKAGVIKISLAHGRGGVRCLFLKRTAVCGQRECAFCIYMMDLRFWDVCAFNFMIRSSRIRKSLLIMLKATPVLLGKDKKVQMDHVANSAKWSNQCSVAYLKATSLKVETDLSV